MERFYDVAVMGAGPSGDNGQDDEPGFICRYSGKKGKACKKT